MLNLVGGTKCLGVHNLILRPWILLQIPWDQLVVFKDVPCSEPSRRSRQVQAPRGSLRPFTRNDEKRARKAQAKEAERNSNSNESKVPTQVQEDPVEFPDAEATGDQEVWEDIHEAVLFEMFDDAKAVEEALLRFAGSSHQAARALEALLARAETKAVEGEDDLDYDCADQVAELQEDWDDEEVEEGGINEEMWCCFCGEWIEDDETAGVAEDGQLYCGWCWDDWQGDEAPEELPPVQAPKRRWGKEEAAPKGPAAPGPTLGRAFFESLDGAPTWAEAPKRPEAGGKELVALLPKEERGTDAVVKGTARATLQVPKAAANSTKALEQSGENAATRCEKLLRSIEPALEDSIVEYLVSMISSSSSEDLSEIQETVVEILEAHDVPAKIIAGISADLSTKNRICIFWFRV
eukprot:symbB.v1.2.032508.t1/scaffold3910.1/size48445/1